MKSLKIFFLFVVLVVLMGANDVYAGTLSCTVTTSCPTGIVVFEMQNTSNSHAEIPGGGSSYTQLVCCTGVSGLGNSCSGTFAKVVNLSKTTNSHVEEGSLSNYSNSVCLSTGAGGSVSVGFQNNNCAGYDTTVGSLSATTNAHVGNSGAFNLKICATAAAAAVTLTQEHYRWYTNANSVTPGSALVAGDTAASAVASSSVIRLRLNVGVSGGTLGANADSFKLQYATSTSGPWTDVGGPATAAIWRGYDNSTPADGNAVVSTLITSSTVAEAYQESVPTDVITNPNAIATGNWGEWDWTLQDNGAPATTNYYFRMVQTSGTVLDSYTRYPSVVTQTTYAPSGSLISDIIDTAATNGVTPNSLYFEGNMPINTAVKFQFAAATATGGPWNYVAWNSSTLSCDGASFYTPGGPSSQIEIKANCHNNKRYIRYKIFLTTSDLGSTPRVDRVILNYAQ